MGGTVVGIVLWRAGGACSEEEQEAITSDVAWHEMVEGCARGALAQEDKTTDCIVSETELSRECASCFGEAVACGFTKCLLDCRSDSLDPACVTCIEEGCDPTTLKCTGLET